MTRKTRRDFGRIVATTAVALGGVGGAVADASAQETDPLQTQDVSVSLGDVNLSFGRATLAFEDGTARFVGREWTMDGPESSLSGDRVQWTVEGVSAETFATIRSAMVEAANGSSALPLFVGLAQADVNPDATVRVSARSVGQEGQVMADRITATGRYGAIVPDDLRNLSKGTLLSGSTPVGPSEWNRMTVTRGDAELVFDGVTVTATPSEARPSETRFDLTFGEITRNGESLISNFETSGTLSELLQALPAQTGQPAQTDDADETDDDADAQQLPKEAIVSKPGGGEIVAYVFEVTGDLRKLEPNEDSGAAVDEVTRRGDRVRVEGGVGSGDDRFAFSGELIEVNVPSGVQIEIQDR